MQHKLVVSFVFGNHLLIDMILIPHRKPLWLILSKVCPHGETSLWEISCLLVLVCHACSLPIVQRSLCSGTKKSARPSCWDEAPAQLRL